MTRASLALVLAVTSAAACDLTSPSPAAPDPNLVLTLEPGVSEVFSGPADSVFVWAMPRDTLGEIRADILPRTWLAESYADLALEFGYTVHIGPSATPWDYIVQAEAGGHTAMATVRVLARPSGRLVFSSGFGGASQLFVKDFWNNGPATQLTSGSGPISGIAVDESLGFVYFGRGTTLPNSDIYRIGIDGSGLLNLTNSVTANNQGPTLNPVTHEVFFSRRDGTVTQVFRMQPDGSGLTLVTNGEQNKIQPAVSPDGLRLAYGEFFQPGFNLEVMVSDIDGSDPVRITDRVGQDVGAFWATNERLLWTGAGLTALDFPNTTTLLTLLDPRITANQPGRECSPGGVSILSVSTAGIQPFRVDLATGRLVRFALPGVSGVTFARRYCD